MWVPVLTSCPPPKFVSAGLKIISDKKSVEPDPTPGPKKSSKSFGDTEELRKEEKEILGLPKLEFNSRYQMYYRMEQKLLSHFWLVRINPPIQGDIGGTVCSILNNLL